MATSPKGTLAIATADNTENAKGYQFPPRPDPYGDVRPPPRRLDVQKSFNKTSGTKSAPQITMAAREHKMDWGRVDTEFGPDLGKKMNAIRDAPPAYTGQGRYKTDLSRNPWVPGPGTYNFTPTLSAEHPTIHREGREWGMTSSLRPEPVGSDVPAPTFLPTVSRGTAWSMTGKSEVGSIFKRKSGSQPGPGEYDPGCGSKARHMPEHTFKNNVTREAPVIGVKKPLYQEPGPGAYKQQFGDKRKASSWSFGKGRSSRFGGKLPPREY
jgi:hypothetical protein